MGDRNVIKNDTDSVGTDVSRPKMVVVEGQRIGDDAFPQRVPPSPTQDAIHRSLHGQQLEKLST